MAEKYVKIGDIPKYVLTNTPFYCDSLVIPKGSNNKIKLVFYVNDGTLTMFELYLLPLISKLCEKYADQIAIYFLSLKPNLKEYEGKIEINYVPHMPFEDFLKYIRNEHFDIGLAPLDEQGFSKYKYFNKYVEYTRAGIAGVYTDCSLYRQVIISEYNGILCDNSPDSWLMAISKLIDDKQLRINIAMNAQKYAKEHFSEDKVVDNLLKNLPEIGNHRAPKLKAKTSKIYFIKICYWKFRLSGWCYTAYSCIRSGNIKFLVKRLSERVGLRSNVSRL